MYKALHPQADVDRLYMKRADGGRGLSSVQDCVDIETNSLHQYIQGSTEKLIIAVREQDILNEGREKEAVLGGREEKYREKALHGQFIQNTEQVRGKGSWRWLKDGKL